jgi:hypothetical protein
MDEGRGDKERRGKERGAYSIQSFLHITYSHNSLLLFDLIYLSISIYV